MIAQRQGARDQRGKLTTLVKVAIDGTSSVHLSKNVSAETIRTTPGTHAPPGWRLLLPSVSLFLLISLALCVRILGRTSGVPLQFSLGMGAVVLLLVLYQARMIARGNIRHRDLIDDHAEQSASLARRMSELELLRSISQGLTEARTLDAVLDVVYEGVSHGLRYDRVGVNLFDHEAGVFEDLIGTDAGGRKYIPENRSLTLDIESPIWRLPGIAALIRGAPYYYTTDATAECPPELQYLFDGEPTHNIMVPLRNHERVTGMISVDNLVSGRPITRDEVGPLLALANQVGMAVENARLLERERHERSRLATMATTDALTGLPNRALLHDRLGQVLRAAGRSREEGEIADPAALLLMDLDGFKEVNDTLGHQVGDRLLQEVAARIHEVVHAADTVARLGGDEFAVLLPESDESRALEITKAILAALDAPLMLEGQILRVGASIGMALYPDHGADSSTLLRCADVAMYVAKRAQSDYALYAHDSDQHSPARLQLLTDLREAIAAGRLEIHYQPLVDVRDRSVKSVEALVRWPHPAHGMLSPDQFIPLAEQTGLIVALTHWVLAEAVRQCKSLQQVTSSLIAVSVNLSARTLHDTELPDIVAAILADHDLPPHHLTLEITETGLMTDPTRSLQVVSRLAELGVRIAIDDFGTGYSSLAYLKNLPVDVLKVDKSFVRGLGKEENRKDIAIIRSIIAMAHLLELQVVAEGVETPEELALLHGLGCDMAQGYHVSHPLAANDFEGWVQSTSWRRGAAPTVSVASDTRQDPSQRAARLVGPFRG